MFIVKEVPYDQMECTEIDDTMAYRFPECIIIGNKDLYSYNTDILSDSDNDDAKYLVKHQEQFSPDEIINILFDITGNRYKYWTIRGTIQREWNYLFYPDYCDEYQFVKILSDKQIREIETEYFNTGSEWIVFDTETEEEYTVYIHEPDPNEKTISEYLGTFPEDMEVHHFKGYQNKPIYD